VSFRCEHCQESFESVWSEADAFAEEARNFGFNSAAADRVILCETCYVKFKAAWDRLPDEEKDSVLLNTRHRSPAA
jgi:hypothetical protein